MPCTGLPKNSVQLAPYIMLNERNPKPTIKAAFALALVSARTYSVYCLTWSETCLRYNMSRSTSTSVSQSRTRAGICQGDDEVCVCVCQ